MTAYHPQANGLVERQHRTLKGALIAKGGDWLQSLPWVLLGLRAGPRSDDDSSPAERVYGWPLTLPGSLLDVGELSAGGLSTALNQLKRGFPVRSQPVDPLAQGVPGMRYAYLREDAVKPPLSPRYQGPYKVLRHTRHSVILRMGDIDIKHSLARVKPYRGSSVPQLAVPPRRGRPHKAGEVCGAP